MRRPRFFVFCLGALLVFGILFIALYGILKETPVNQMSGTSAIASFGPGQYYIADDGPVDIYNCPSIDCDVVATLNAGTTITVIGMPQGDALVPIRYQSTTAYVMDTWLTQQISAPSMAAPREAEGPTARCKDGWISYSKHHRGTCSYHGGVGTWYK